MSSYPCPDDCGRTYQSLKASLQCPCDTEDVYGYPIPVRGTEWLP